MTYMVLKSVAICLWTEAIGSIDSDLLIQQ